MHLWQVAARHHNEKKNANFEERKVKSRLPHVHTTFVRGKNNQSFRARSLIIWDFHSQQRAAAHLSLPKSGFPMIVFSFRSSSENGREFFARSRRKTQVEGSHQWHFRARSLLHMKCDRWLDSISHFSFISFPLSITVPTPNAIANEIMFPCQVRSAAAEHEEETEEEKKTENPKPRTRLQEVSLKSQDSLLSLFDCTSKSRFLIQF